jgi:hypothetical protein
MTFFRTGGNVQDLFTRVFCAVLGSLWAGLAYAAGNGNPYIIAVFAAIYVRVGFGLIFTFFLSDIVVLYMSTSEARG